MIEARAHEDGLGVRKLLARQLALSPGSSDAVRTPAWSSCARRALLFASVGVPSAKKLTSLSRRCTDAPLRDVTQSRNVSIFE